MFLLFSLDFVGYMFVCTFEIEIIILITITN